MKKFETYQCSVCGNSVEVSHVGGGTLHCCGKEMTSVTQSITQVNLIKAFAGESMARNRYEYYAKIAQKEGLRDIAAHFQRAADNEKTHAKLELKLYNLLTISQEFGETKENLLDAINGEHYENSSMYPQFAALAHEEGESEAARLFEAIGKVEIEHEAMYRRLLERLESGKEYESDDEEEEWICEVCGHVHRGKKALKVCPVCKHPQEYQSRMNTLK